MYCTQCGAYLARRHLRFCPYCSVSLAAALRRFCPECGVAFLPERAHTCLEAALAPGNLPPALWKLLAGVLLFPLFGIPAFLAAVLAPRRRSAGEPECADALARLSRVLLFLAFLAFFLLFFVMFLLYAIFCKNN